MAILTRANEIREPLDNTLLARHAKSLRTADTRLVLAQLRQASCARGCPLFGVMRTPRADVAWRLCAAYRQCTPT